MCFFIGFDEERKNDATRGAIIFIRKSSEHLVAEVSTQQVLLYNKFPLSSFRDFLNFTLNLIIIHQVISLKY